MNSGRIARAATNVTSDLMSGPAALVATMLFTLTALAGAFLLFMIQPLFSRMSLPYLGGTPAVWNTAMVFFQVVLLLGYAWTHLSLRWLSLGVQMGAQAIIMLSALAFLPIALNPSLAPTGEGSPYGWLLGVYAVSIGLPFFAVSTLAPLLQRWLSRTRHPDADDPYFLYAASNVGSIGALLAYPLLVEPTIGLAEQGRAWTFVYAGSLVLLAGCAAFTARSLRGAERESRTAVRQPESASTWRLRGRWVFLAAVPSSLLLSVTRHLTTDVAAVPFLWILPLTLFLLTFVIVFSRRPLLPHSLVLRIQPLVLVFLPLLLIQQFGDFRVSVIAHLLAFFVCAMVCHGELARQRPDAARLTEFYLYMSIGGALGGALTAIAAPLLFDAIYEYPIGILLACLARPSLADAKGGAEGEGGRRWSHVAVVVTIAAILLLMVRITQPDTLLESLSLEIRLVLLLVLVMVILRLARDRLVLLTGILGLLVYYSPAGVDPDDTLERYRGFYGAMTIERSADERTLLLKHGTTIHGAQFIDPMRKSEPTSYFSKASPAGQALEALGRADRLEQVGLVGLGAGTLLCYRNEGQRWRVFEIDPLVEYVARDSGHFSFIETCAPEVPVVLGDARLSLSDEQDGRYDLIILDAFSSDAIPVHLLTREALGLYRRKLASGGVLLAHISNRHLDLRPVLARLAADAGLPAVTRTHVATPSDDKPQFAEATSTWVAIGTDDDALAPLTASSSWVPLVASDDQELWTDDFSNVLELFFEAPEW